MRLTSFPLAVLLLLGPPAKAQEAEDATSAAPWQAQIYSSNSDWKPEELAARAAWDLAHKCGGSLIAPGWVLTAAHCINQKRIENGHRVRLGTDYIDDDSGISYRIVRMVRHADWDQPNHRNDIALVQFAADGQTRPEAAGPVEAIPLYDGPPLEPGVEVYATGWGQLEPGKDRGFQSELTHVELVTADCAEFPEYAGKVQAYQLCATGRGNDPDAAGDTCKGDSGGPLVLEGDRPRLVGIVNWGIGCYRPGSAGIYLRIDQQHFAEWIARAMASDPSVTELR